MKYPLWAMALASLNRIIQGVTSTKATGSHVVLAGATGVLIVRRFWELRFPIGGNVMVTNHHGVMNCHG
jgi:hypothetical protein